jgi:orotate phosphoribosyltransferase-like protein
MSERERRRILKAVERRKRRGWSVEQIASDVGVPTETLRGLFKTQKDRKKRIREIRKQVLALRDAGLTFKEIGQRLGLGESTVRHHLAIAAKHRPPTPEQIRERCLEIQKGWSPKERAQRAGIFGRQSAWMPPVVQLAEVA